MAFEKYTDMSKTGNFINISPPDFVRGENEVEVINCIGHPCSYCHGDGFFWSATQRGEPIKKECPICLGTGKLDAEVTIEWKASKI